MMPPILPVANVDRYATVIERILGKARIHLGMDVAFIGEFVGGNQVVRDISGSFLDFGVKQIVPVPLEMTYCQRVVDGRIPNAIPDTLADPRVRNLPMTQVTGVRAYIGIPLVLSDGRLYGTLCCANRRPDAVLGERDVQFMQVLAEIIVELLENQGGLASTVDEGAVAERIREVLSGNGIQMQFQPIVDLRHANVVGAEALARFPDAPPDVRFAEAWSAGHGIAFEMAAIRAALQALPMLPDGVYMSLNVSPQTTCTTHFRDVLAGHDLRRIMIEITEHAPVDDYDALNRELGELRATGLRFAVDDAGAGYSSLRHILRLRPDVIKLDITLTHDVARDPVRRALVGALVRFASDIDATMVAEGVESHDEAEALRALGVNHGQGWFFARPSMLPFG